MRGHNWRSSGFHGSPFVCNSWNSRGFYKQLVKCLCGGVGMGSEKLDCLCYLCIRTVLMWNSLLLIFKLNSHRSTKQKYVLLPLSTVLSKLNVRPSPVILSSWQWYSCSSGMAALQQQVLCICSTGRKYRFFIQKNRDARVNELQ